MITKRIFYVLFFVLLMAFPLAAVHAQQPDFVDTDGDTIPDPFDGCPTDAGLPENAGCPDGVAPPDTDGDTVPDVYDGCPDVAGDPFMSGCQDVDGDTVPDNFDACPDQAGFTQNSGCPAGVLADFDGDGIADRDDYCYDLPGDAANAGCPADQSLDDDGDGVPNFSDACYADQGSADNFGCPPDVTPDFDADGVPDAQDQCPRFFGSPDNGGCMVDSDGDLLEDQYDACPSEPGDGRNNGCPEGSSAPDTDGDTVPDIYDRCVNEAGVNGLDCPDTDGDTIGDIDDACPNEAGDPALRGCVPVTEASLPASRAPLSASNITGISFLTQLNTSVSSVEVSASGTMAVKTWTSGILLYDITQTELSPSPLEAVDGSMAISADGRVLVDAPYFMENLSSPAVQVWDTTTGTGLQFLEITNETPVNVVAVSPDGSRFATGHGFFSFFGEPLPDNSNNIHLYDTATGSELSVLSNPAGVVQLAFSPDGTRLAAGTDVGVVIWDVASGQQLAVNYIPAHFAGKDMAFSPDGTKLAYGQNGGGVTVLDMNTFDVLYTVPVVSHERFNTAIVGVAFSPDGSLLVVSGGPFVDGPPLEDFNNQVVFLDAATGSPLHSIDNLATIPNSVKFSGDGTLLIFNNSPSIEFWGIAQ